MAEQVCSHFDPIGRDAVTDVEAVRRWQVQRELPETEPRRKAS